MNQPIPPRLLVDVSPKTFGWLGFILFTLAIFLVAITGAIYNWGAMLIGIAIFICGGFSGRCIQKQLSKN